MSSQSYSTFQSSSYSSYSDSSGNRFEESTSSNPTGTTTHRTSQEAGKPPVSETTRVPAGRQVDQVGGDQRRIEDVSEVDDQANLEDEEKLDEYARKGSSA